MSKKINKIRNSVKKKYKPDIWKYHILPVVKHAMQLADVYKANREVVELAALLHDIGRTGLEDKEGHHIVGVPIAEKILKKQGFSEKVIEEVKHCILTHRTSKGPAPETIAAKIVANADAMAYFDVFPMFFYWEGREERDFEKAMEWTENKLRRDWGKKLTLPKAKNIVKEQYKAIKLLLKVLNQYKKSDEN